MAQENIEKPIQNPYAVRYTLKENPNALWYVVHTYSGHERKVAITLGERARVMELSDKITDSFIPTQKKIIITSSKKKEVDCFRDIFS